MTVGRCLHVNCTDPDCPARTGRFRDATAGETACNRCDGAGLVGRDHWLCPKCHGAGVVAGPATLFDAVGGRR